MQNLATVLKVDIAAKVTAHFLYLDRYFYEGSDTKNSTKDTIEVYIVKHGPMYSILSFAIRNTN